jgi:hypothetical protein
MDIRGATIKLIFRGNDLSLSLNCSTVNERYMLAAIGTINSVVIMLGNEI